MKNGLKLWMYDFILSICILIVVAAAMVYSYLLESPREKLFLARPDVYMAMWFLFLALLAVLLMIRALKLRRTPEGQAPGTPMWCNVGVFTVVVLFFYLITLKKLGFILDSFLMLWILTLVYTFNIGEQKKNFRDKAVFVKEFVKTGIFSLITSWAIYFIFTRVLTSKLPVFLLFK